MTDVMHRAMVRDLGIETIIGSWRLVRWNAVAAQRVSQPFSDNPFGRLLYQPDGVMAAFLQHPDWTGADFDLVLQRTRFIAYSGRYEIEGATVVHHVDVGSDPRWIGHDLIRQFEIAGDELRIVAMPASSFGIGAQEHHLHWHREQSATRT